jgi:hypothetical protein
LFHPPFVLGFHDTSSAIPAFTIIRYHFVGNRESNHRFFQGKDAVLCVEQDQIIHSTTLRVCPAPKPGQKYYEFFGAVRDETKNTGVIFIPMFGEEAADYLNRIGEKVVENYNKSTNRESGGRC